MTLVAAFKPRYAGTADPVARASCPCASMARMAMALWLRLRRPALPPARSAPRQIVASYSGLIYLT